MIIKSLLYLHSGEKIITDIDDCVMNTSNSIRKHGLSIRDFWFNNETYEQNKQSVFENSELTEWGRELLLLIKSGKVKKVEFITSATGRLGILKSKFGINDIEVKESMLDGDKVVYLNSINEESIYVDDKMKVNNGVTNTKVRCLQYPKRILRKRS